MDKTATPAPEDAAPEAAPKDAAPTPIEPLMGLESFVSTAALSPWMTAAFRRWMLVTKRDPHHYFAHSVWQDFLAQARQHPVS